VPLTDHAQNLTVGEACRRCFLQVRLAQQPQGIFGKATAVGAATGVRGPSRAGSMRQTLEIERQGRWQWLPFKLQTSSLPSLSWSTRD
jgi:hypothetical protein